jgi:hypothetical protein
MPLPEHWATPEDYATLFQYVWHRDFQMDQGSPGARRVDWTIHNGIVVRTIADLLGLVTRFERGARKDAILRSREGDEIAVEWEWGGVWGGNELKKLRDHKVWVPPGVIRDSLLKFAVLMTYTHPPNIERVHEHVTEEWRGARWPLLLILVDLEETKKFPMGKDFKNINMSLFDCDGRGTELRVAPAFPWNVESTRWSFQAF